MESAALQRLRTASASFSSITPPSPSAFRIISL
jgi:hypothetical protein